jgi:hypothetical protein
MFQVATRRLAMATASQTLHRSNSQVGQAEQTKRRFLPTGQRHPHLVGVLE